MGYRVSLKDIKYNPWLQGTNHPDKQIGFYHFLKPWEEKYPSQGVVSYRD